MVRIGAHIYQYLCVCGDAHYCFQCLMMNDSPEASTHLIHYYPPIYYFPPQDACNAETTIVKGTALEISWPETELGENSTIGCPCGNVDSDAINRQASRMCGGSYSGGVDWIAPYDAECRFGDTALELCKASLVGGDCIHCMHGVQLYISNAMRLTQVLLYTLQSQQYNA